MEMRVLVWFFTICMLPMVHAQDFDLEVDKRNWIDPTDMLNYDTVKRVMKKTAAEETVDSKPPVTNENKPNKTCEILLEKCAKTQSKLQECERSLASANSCNYETDTPYAELPYMKRYVHQLLNHFYTDSNLQQDYKVTVQLTEQDKTTLNKFVKSDRSNLREVDEIVSRIVLRSQTISLDDELSNDWAVNSINLEFLVVVLVLCAAWLALIKLSLFKCVLLFMLISTFWHWKHLYQQAVAHRVAELAKLNNVPSECQSNEPQGFFYQFGKHTLKAIFGKNADNCEKYYEAVGVDPVWEISPSLAFSEAVGQFFTHPLGILGSNIGTFYYNLNENLPWFSYYIILTATLVFAFFALMAVFKYRVRMPFGIFSIEPTPMPTVQTTQSAPAQVCQDRNSPPAIRTGVEGQLQTNRQLTEHAMCTNCHIQFLPTVERQNLVVSYLQLAGAGDQCSPKTRESVQEIKALCSNDGENISGDKSSANKEAGDSASDSPLPTELSPSSSKFLSELRSTLRQ